MADVVAGDAQLALRSAEQSVGPVSPTEATAGKADTAVAVETWATPRDAYASRDTALSRVAHDLKAGAVTEAAKENHGGIGSDFVKSIVFGGLDGVITTFSIVAASAGASLAVQTALLLGVSNLIADGLSMGVGDFLSSAAELKHIKAETEREKWEFENYPEGEIAEMVEIYEKKGVAKADAETILKTMAKYPDIFLNHMVQEELGLPPFDPDENPAKDGLVTFLSFLLFGSVPVIAYAICYGANYQNAQGIFGIACGATVATMFLLGAVQAAVTRQPMLKSALIMTFNGTVAAASAYLVGWGLDHAFNGNGQN